MGSLSKGAKSTDSLHKTTCEAEKRTAEITQHRDGKVISHKRIKLKK